MTIYVDVVLIENLIMNYIILFATDIILKNKSKFWRLLLASLIGAIYTVISYISNLKIYSSMILKMILSIIIVYVAFNPQNMKKMWKSLLIFYLTSLVFGGAAFALIYIVKPQETFLKNGLFLGTYSLKTILLSAIVAFLIIIAAFTVVKNKISKRDMFCNIKIKLNDKEIEAKAMLDTGNLLKEPITNIPVIVVEHTLLYECIPKQILNNIDDILGGDFSKIPDEIKQKYMTKLKFIPFSSLGKQNGMLLGIKADYVIIKNENDEEKKVNEIIIGIYNKSLTKRGEYRVLMGLELF